MKVEKNVVRDEMVKELSRKFGKKEKVIEIMIDVSLKKEYNITDLRKVIEEFYTI